MNASDETGVWLYAVTPEAGAAALGGLTGVSAEHPRAVTAGRLAAVVGDVPLSSFGAEALRRNLEDLDWLAAVARAHDSVVAALVEQGPVAPVRLATVYHDDASVRVAVEERGADFERTLEHVSGRVEWGVKAFLQSEPEPAAAVPDAEGPGVAYLARRRSALASQEERQQRAADQVSRLHAALSELAADACTHPPQSRALTDQDGPMMLNGAYLVDAGEAGRFAEAVDSRGRDSTVLTVELTGPWPPYSFSSSEEP
ncbi:GvpL/GvpF family gas vesicle protein [Amycolatopsis sp. NPDC005232]|uniref:GvpL/GvpF family gas vesicle protein n=1 Tax=Amycolatopsis sp. NPDC005232 TaxID=3157027 RepID=UPI0033A65650